MFEFWKRNKSQSKEVLYYPWKENIEKNVKSSTIAVLFIVRKLSFEA